MFDFGSEGEREEKREEDQALFVLILVL